MFYRRLRTVEDQELGGLGLKFVNTRKFCNGMFTIKDGTLLAHDVLEHQQGINSIGSIGDEMLALGGICYTRGQWGILNHDGRGSHYSIEENIAADILHMARLYFEDRVPFRQKLTRSRKDDPTNQVDNVIEAARDGWETRADFNGDPPSADKRDTYLETCRVYMLHGAKLADRRFGSGILANQMFWEIHRVTNKTIKQIEFEGQEFTLGYDFRGNVTFSETTTEYH